MHTLCTRLVRRTSVLDTHIHRIESVVLEESQAGRTSSVLECPKFKQANSGFDSNRKVALMPMLPNRKIPVDEKRGYHTHKQRIKTTSFYRLPRLIFYLQVERQPLCQRVVRFVGRFNATIAAEN